MEAYNNTVKQRDSITFAEQIENKVEKQMKKKVYFVSYISKRKEN